MAAMSPDKSRSLHNFSLPPALSWGAQRVLRCSKTNPSTGDSVDGDDHHYHRRPGSHAPYEGSSSSSRSRRDPAEPDRKRRFLNSSPDKRAQAAMAGLGFARGGEEDERIEVIREKLMIDLQTEVDKIKNAILAEGGDGETDPRLPLPPPPPADAEPRTWNLRTRRATCRDPNASGGGGEEPRPRSSPPAMNLPSGKSDLDGENCGGGRNCMEKIERPKFSVSLSREEIEEDFLELTRRRPARKPKKRSKYIQKQLDTLFPGLWLSEITPDMYKVNENPEGH